MHAIVSSIPDFRKVPFLFTRTKSIKFSSYILPNANLRFFSTNKYVNYKIRWRRGVGFVICNFQDSFCGFYIFSYKKIAERLKKEKTFMRFLHEQPYVKPKTCKVTRSSLYAILELWKHIDLKINITFNL